MFSAEALFSYQGSWSHDYIFAHKVRAIFTNIWLNVVSCREGIKKLILCDTVKLSLKQTQLHERMHLQ